MVGRDAGRNRRACRHSHHIDDGKEEGLILADCAETQRREGLYKRINETLFLLIQLIQKYPMQINIITGIIIEEAIKLHNNLGPGLLESVYEEVLSHCLKGRGFIVKRQVPIPVFYDGIKMEIGFRADLIVNDCVIIEVKSVEMLAPVHHKQLLTYLKLTDISVGLIINFNEVLLKKGIKRIVNNFDPALSAPLREINKE